MTANAMALRPRACLEAGMNDHIAKPIDPDQLFGVLLRWIKRQPMAPPVDGTAIARHSERTANSVIAIDDRRRRCRSGLRRTGSNPKRYKTLLRRFAQQQAGTVDTIRNSLGHGRAATAERAAHSLKGAAGTLGAAALSSCRKAETAIKAGQGADSALFRSRSPWPGRGWHSRRAAGPADLPMVGRQPRPRNGRGPLARLKRLLENDDGEAADFIDWTRARLARVLHRRRS